MRTRPTMGELGGDGLQPIRASCGEDDVVSFGREPAGDPLADPAAHPVTSQ